MSIASLTGLITLSPSFEWIGTYPALVSFGTASILEISAYYIPWLDNILDTVATPTAFIAGTVVMASTVADMSPFIKWTLALIVGGGVAGSIQGFTSLTRITSSATTGGLGNPVLSTLEAGGSTVLSILSITLPILAGILVLGILYFAWKKLFKRFFKHSDFKLS
jgi:uncharacterized membrane protein